MKIAFKYIAIGIIGLLSSFSINAQETQKTMRVLAPKVINHEVSVYGGGGLSTLRYNANFGEQTNQMGGLFGVGYSYFFTKNIGLVTGFEFASHNAKGKMNSFTDKYTTVDSDGETFDFSSKITNHNEKQNTMFFNIPIMVQYQTTGKIKFYGALGAKIGIPIYKKYKVSRADYYNTGYYKASDETYNDNDFLGFGNFYGRSTRNDLDLKMSFTLAGEAGVKWKLMNRLNLYTGVYADYGLNNINKKTDKYLVEYNANYPNMFVNNSMLHSVYHLKGAHKSVDKINLLSVGLKVKLSFNL